MDKLLDKQLGNIVKEIDKFRKSADEMQDRKKSVDALDKIRKESGLTKAAFAKKLGIERQAYEDVLRHRYSRDYVDRLVKSVSKKK